MSAAEFTPEIDALLTAAKQLVAKMSRGEGQIGNEPFDKYNAAAKALNEWLAKIEALKLSARRTIADREGWMGHAFVDFEAAMDDLDEFEKAKGLLASARDPDVAHIAAAIFALDSAPVSADGRMAYIPGKGIVKI